MERFTETADSEIQVNLTNNTIGYGPARGITLFNQDGSDATDVTVYIRNHISWENDEGGVGGMAERDVLIEGGLSTATLAVSHSDTQQVFAGSGNINLFPEFIDGAAGDFRLSASPDVSPCIDAGLNLWWSVITDPEIPNLDLDGNTRIVDGVSPFTAAIIDMGSYEFQN